MCLMKGPHEPGIDDILIQVIVSNGPSWGRLLISSRSARRASRQADQLNSFR